MKKTLTVVASPSDATATSNEVYFFPGVFPSPCYVYVEGKKKKGRHNHVFLAKKSNLVERVEDEEEDEVKNDEVNEEVKKLKDTIALNKIQRISSGCSKGREIECTVFTDPVPDIKRLTVDCRYKNERNCSQTICAFEFVESFVKLMKNHIVVRNQEIPILIEDIEQYVIVTVKDIEVFVPPEKKKEIGEEPENIGKILAETCLSYRDSRSSRKVFDELPQNRADKLFKENASFRDMGIGGLDDELMTLFRRAFASRIYPKELIEKFGIQHVKGVMLSGPPGTGKTLTARQIGKILNTVEPKIVNGPEILNKFVGESERSIRALFKEAEEEYAMKGDSSRLHLIIFDEIDAICKSRGTVRSSTGVNDSVVNQLLSKIDGVDALNNILVIGMTNRKDLIDEALLRAGRFEVHIDIGLPNEEGRAQIFDIHTRQMRHHSVIDDDIDLHELAEQTDNYSGAEIAGVVRSAVTFALNEHVHFNNMEKTLENLAKVTHLVRVRMCDFKKALREVRPSFGISEDLFKPYLAKPLIPHGKRFALVRKTMENYISKMVNHASQSLMSVLLWGEKGTGKTSFAIHSACQTSFPFVKMVSLKHLLRLPETDRIRHISHIFDQAYKSPLSIVILDDIERIISYFDEHRFSNNILQVLMMFLNHPPPKGHKLLIIGTTSMSEYQQTDMNMKKMFNFTVHIPALNCDEIKEVLSIVKLEGDMDKCVSAVEEIPIKKLLLILDMARTEKGITEGSFLEAVEQT